MRALFYEFYKIMIKQKAIMYTFLFICIKLVSLLLSSSYSVETTEQNKILYKQYLINVNGKLTEEKERFITDEEKQMNEKNSEKINIVSKYLNREISEEEYILKLKDIDNALKKRDAFKILYDQYQYVKQDPENRYFLYTNGWTNLLAPDSPDMILIFLLLIVITPIFTYEYEKNMVPLILTSKKGKAMVPIHKIIAASIITIAVTISFSAIEYIYCYLKYGLPSGDFPLQSVPFFKTSRYHLSLNQAYLYISLIKVIGFLAFTYLIIFVSVASRKTVIALFASLSGILVPYFIYFDDSIKYKLPLPLGFMIGNGYFRGSDDGIKTVRGAVKFLEISKQAFILELVYMIILSSLLVMASAFMFSKSRIKGGRRFEKN